MIMETPERNRIERRIMSLIIEELGADAAVFIYSDTRQDETTTYLNTRGNRLACTGLVEMAYGHMCEGVPADEVIEDDDDDNGETESDGATDGTV